MQSAWNRIQSLNNGVIVDNSCRPAGKHAYFHTVAIFLFGSFQLQKCYVNDHTVL